jgi:hypothetical protein
MQRSVAVPQVQIPLEFALAVLERLIESGTPPRDRRDALALLALTISSLEPPSYVSGKSIGELAAPLGMLADEFARSAALLARVNAATLVRRGSRRFVAVTPYLTGARLTRADRVTRRRLDDALEDVFRQACAAENLGAAVDLLAVLVKWNNNRKARSGRRRRTNDMEIEGMRAELERLRSIRSPKAVSNGTD